MSDLPVAEANVFEVIGTQRAMRRLKPDPVPEEYIKQLIWAATRAPSGGNRQPWRFLVVTDAEKRAALAGLYKEAWDGYAPGAAAVSERLSGEEAASNDRVVKSSQYLADHMHEVPVLIVVCSLASAAVNAGIASGSSIYPAVQNLMLAARALGLGTALTTLHRQREDKVREILGIPETVDTAALIPVGWPMGRFGEGKRQPVEAVTYWDSWGAKRQ